VTRKAKTPARPKKGRGSNFSPARLEEVRKRIATCRPRPRIEAELAAEWGVTTRQVRKYVALVYEQLREEAKETAAHRKDEVREQMYEVVRRCLDADNTAFGNADYRTAIRALENIAKLDGLYAPEKVEHTGAGGGPLRMEQVEVPDAGWVEDRVAKLLAKRPDLLRKVAAKVKRKGAA
jgi:hypothetical protein